jgi:hypothetical protein
MVNGSIHIEFKMQISDGYAYGGSGLDGDKLYSVVIDPNGTVTSAASSITGTTSAETLVGTGLQETITGGGGADRIFAGDGDDLVILNASNITSFASANTMLVDAGAGVNVLKFADTGTLDLTNATVAAKVKNFSVIDMTGTGNNTLKLNLAAVSTLSGTTDNSSTVNVNEGKMLVVNGNSGDALQIVGLAIQHSQQQRHCTDWRRCCRYSSECLGRRCDRCRHRCCQRHCHHGRGHHQGHAVVQHQWRHQLDSSDQCVRQQRFLIGFRQ